MENKTKKLVKNYLGKNLIPFLLQISRTSTKMINPFFQTLEIIFNGLLPECIVVLLRTGLGEWNIHHTAVHWLIEVIDNRLFNQTYVQISFFYSTVCTHNNFEFMLSFRVNLIPFFVCICIPGKWIQLTIWWAIANKQVACRYILLYFSWNSKLMNSKVELNINCRRKLFASLLVREIFH